MTHKTPSPQGVSAEEVIRQKKEITNLLMRKISQANDLVLEIEKEVDKIKADRNIFRKGFEALEETLKESAKQNKLLSDELWQLKSLPDKGVKEGEIVLPSEEEILKKIKEYGEAVYESTSDAQIEWSARKAFRDCYEWIKSKSTIK